MSTGLTVREFMTPMPHTIGADQTLMTAHDLMREFKIRHLPVLRDGKLVGIVSQRDLQFIESLPNVDTNSVLVEEAMSEPAFALSPNSALEWISMEMAQHKYGSTVIVENEKVVGVFTTVDALRALQELLRRARRGGRGRARERRAS